MLFRSCARKSSPGKEAPPTLEVKGPGAEAVCFGFWFGVVVGLRPPSFCLGPVSRCARGAVRAGGRLSWCDDGLVPGFLVYSGGYYFSNPSIPKSCRETPSLSREDNTFLCTDLKKPSASSKSISMTMHSVLPVELFKLQSL